MSLMGSRVSMFGLSKWCCFERFQNFQDLGRSKFQDKGSLRSASGSASNSLLPDSIRCEELSQLTDGAAAVPRDSCPVSKLS